MSQYEFDNNQEGDWEENEDIAWNEADWQNFLRKSEKEVSRFISAYNKVKNEPDRLDAAAVIMGWHRDDWSSIDEFDLEDEEEIIRNPKPLIWMMMSVKWIPTPFIAIPYTLPLPGFSLT